MSSKNYFQILINLFIVNKYSQGNFGRAPDANINDEHDGGGDIDASRNKRVKIYKFDI